ncbi:hypothetical protein K443DRAFT_686435 [Laccaria amethystina LaAM-08-1]|uniref:Unplaced genomic scaffold K443scaffold_567, whole genome shotgun sequence n=1 Tax=Laccaria amethystina LaAM-08-1 TaxID=1095629 RepID=A0A0C9WS59_9AGAR|nr:hypothetical protein K443DRAFT_686435 [Laccaria amethystina LaAM-08-1]
MLVIKRAHTLNHNSNGVEVPHPRALYGADVHKSGFLLTSCASLFPAGHCGLSKAL